MFKENMEDRVRKAGGIVANDITVIKEKYFKGEMSKGKLMFELSMMGAAQLVPHIIAEGEQKVIDHLNSLEDGTLISLLSNFTEDEYAEFKKEHPTFAQKYEDLIKKD